MPPARRPGKSPQPKAQPKTVYPVYKDGLNGTHAIAVVETPRYPVDPPGLHRGRVTLQAHLLKQSAASYTETGARKWVDYQARWGLGEACRALGAQPFQAPNTRASAALLSVNLDAKQKFQFHIRCDDVNEQEFINDETAPSEYECEANQDLTFDCEITWRS